MQTFGLSYKQRMKDEGRSTRITIAFTPDELGGIDAWMRERGILRGRSEAIRTLIQSALSASPPAPKRPRKPAAEPAPAKDKKAPASPKR